ncbi:M48 family metallopeptidase [Neptunomonas marina]|uniref:Peptidase M48 domain-containing protein n=1 Tax=Neptunomonas marina TaxID=1815562 RepID=A0A437Q8V7_9GAMM|nr:M48 family metallopeptidase [Neptunomonas marina]RVU31011.1 hypothetical protein EOE65_08340 [Neptunomonas marina]
MIEKVNPEFDEDSIVRRGVKADFYYTMDESRGFIRDRQAEQYVNNILSHIKKASGFNIEGKAYLIPSRAINARAHADGNIYINYGALVQLENEASFVAIVAHEYAHLLLGHHYSDRYLAYQKRLFKIKNRIMSLKYSIERSLRDKQTTSQEYSLKRDALFQLIFLTEGFINPTWQRSQELEADMLAYDLMQRAGYSTGGFSEFFNILEKSEHDLEAERKAELESLIENSSLTDKFKIASTEMVRSLSRLFSEDHPPADVREDSLRSYKLASLKYFQRLGIRASKLRGESAQWRALKKRRTTQRIYDAIENAKLARLALASGNAGDAGKYSAKARKASWWRSVVAISSAF